MTPDDLRNAYKHLFDTEDGKIVLEDLQKRFHIYGTVFATDPNETAYCEGQRTVVLFIQKMLLDLKLPEEVSNE